MQVLHYYSVRRADTKPLAHNTRDERYHPTQTSAPAFGEGGEVIEELVRNYSSSTSISQLLALALEIPVTQSIAQVVYAKSRQARFRPETISQGGLSQDACN
jgi:hypothetical protein